ncbi:MAG: polysulfide reductase NrfD [Planctomycetes bacterium]|nr:polysulfide reductase NrfD [Planctomycetota bacterium]
MSVSTVTDVVRTLELEDRTNDGAAGGGPPESRIGVGRFGTRWWAFSAMLAAVVTASVAAYARQLARGLEVTGLGNIGSGGAPWGLYITFDVYFVGVSFAGITLAALIRLFDLSKLRPVSRMAELLTIVSLMMGALSVIVDCGRPLEALVNIPRFARTASPFFGTFSLVVGGYLFASLVYFFLSGRSDAAACAQPKAWLRGFHRLWASGYQGSPAEKRRHHCASFWLALTILPLLVTAHSTLGFIFGIQGGRPGWFSALQGPSFVVMAGLSGTGLLIVMAAVLRRSLRLEAHYGPPVFRWLGNLLMVLTMIYLYFMIAEELTATYASPYAESKVAHARTLGVYAPLYWTIVAFLAGTVAILFIQFVHGGASIAWTAAAGLLGNVAAVLKRYLLIVSPQTHGLFVPTEGSYAPSGVEIAVILGLLALGALFITIFVKVFPIVPLAGSGHPAEPDPTEPRRKGPSRCLMFWAMLAVGVGLAAIGFLGSSRFGTEPYLDPVIPYSPVLFIAGVMLAFTSAIVYETAPLRIPTRR